MGNQYKSASSGRVARVKTSLVSFNSYLEISRNAKLVSAIRDDNKLPFWFPKKIYFSSHFKHFIVF